MGVLTAAMPRPAFAFLVAVAPRGVLCGRVSDLSNDISTDDEVCCCSAEATPIAWFDGPFKQGQCFEQAMCADGDVVGQFHEPWSDMGAPPEDGALEEHKVIFIDYDSTLNPGQGNTPLTEARQRMLTGFFARWKAENPNLRLIILTASNADVKRAALAPTPVSQYIDDVQKSGTKGPWIKEWITSNKEFSSKTALFIDDSPEMLSEVIYGEDDGLPICHTFRLPDKGAGFTANDLSFVQDRFVHQAWAGNEEGLLHMNVFMARGARVIDVEDSLEKMTMDMLRTTRAGFLTPHLAAGPDGGPTANFLEWILGRPDYADEAGFTGEEVGEDVLSNPFWSLSDIAPVCADQSRLHRVKEAGAGGKCMPAEGEELSCPSGADMFCSHDDLSSRCCCSDVDGVNEKVVLKAPAFVTDRVKKMKTASDSCGSFLCRCSACGE